MLIQLDRTCCALKPESIAAMKPSFLPTDESTSLADVRRLVAAFVDERRWQQFHSPKNLSMALAIEAAELMEHFQWISLDDSRQIARDQHKLQEVRDELADVLCYVLAMANALDIDLASALAIKMQKNLAKYPAEEYRGRFGPDDPNPVRSE